MASDNKGVRSKRMYALRDIAKIKVDKRSPLATTNPFKNSTTSPVTSPATNSVTNPAKSPAKVFHQSIPLIRLNGQPIDDPETSHLTSMLPPAYVHPNELMLMTVEERERRIDDIISRVMASEEKEMLQQSNWAPPLNANEDRSARIPIGQPSLFRKDLTVIMNCQKMQKLIDEQEKQCFQMINSKKIVPSLGEYRLNFSNQYREQTGSENRFPFNIQLDSIVTSYLQSHTFPNRKLSPPKGRQ